MAATLTRQFCRIFMVKLCRSVQRHQTVVISAGNQTSIDLKQVPDLCPVSLL
jgi:hypothetical protein